MANVVVAFPFLSSQTDNFLKKTYLLGEVHEVGLERITK
jgi:hypothetical protein